VKQIFNVTSPDQLSLSFEPGLTAKHRRLEDCCAAVVYNHRGGLDEVAASLDMSPSEFSRRLNAHVPQKEHDEKGNRPLRVDDLVGIVAKTGDCRPIYWLIEKFLRDPEAQRTQAINQLSTLMPVIAALVEQSAPIKGRGR
jgi:hypothetical protein